MSERAAFRVLIRCLCLPLLLPTGACESKEPGGADLLTARTAAIDTLAETDSLFVARVTRAYVGPNGHAYVSDHVQRRVVEFDLAGRVVRSIGRGGEGPGEFLGPLAVAAWGEDSLVVTDLTNRRISVFRRSDGEFLWHAEGLGSVSSLGAAGDAMVVASLAVDSFTSIGVLGRGQRTVRRALPLPDSLLRQPLAVAAYPRSVVGVGADRIVVGLLWSDIAFEHSWGLEAQSSFVIPRRHRRPIPADLDQALAPEIAGPGRLTLIPSLMTIEPFRNGWFAFIHKDWTAPPGGLVDASRAATEASLRAFATIVDLEGKRACPDIELPVDWAENPAFASDGSTLVGIGHAVGASGRPALERRRYELQLDSCSWVPLQFGGT